MKKKERKEWNHSERKEFQLTGGEPRTGNQSMTMGV